MIFSKNIVFAKIVLCRLFAFLIILIATKNSAESQGVDRKILEAIQNLPPKSQCDTLNKLGYQLGKNRKFDSALLFLSDALIKSKKINYLEGQARALNYLGVVAYNNKTPIVALSYLRQSLIIAEKEKNLELIAINYSNLGEVYLTDHQGRQALNSLLMALPLAKQAAISEDINALTRLQYLYFSLNSAYISLKNYDSANIYLAAAYKLSEKTNQGKGEIWEAMGQNEMQNKKYNTAISYFKNSEADAIGSNNLDLLSTIYLHYSSYYDLLQQSDSVVYYSKKSIVAETENNLDVLIASNNRLAEYYKDKEEKDSAFKYLSAANSLLEKKIKNDSSSYVLEFSIEENKRQNDNKLKIIQEENERMHKLQYFGIFIFIVFIFSVLTIFYRLKIRLKLIKWFAIISLLLFFEFILMLFHPIIYKLTYNIPIYVFLASVLIASIISPVHHFLNDTLLKKLGIHGQGHR